MNKQTDRIATAIRRYVERVLPQLERSGGFPDSPMDRDAKGESNPPVGDYALMLLVENKEAGRMINPLLNQMERQNIGYGSVSFSDALRLARYDSGAFVRWQSQPGAAKAVQVMYGLLAHALQQRHGKDVEVHVVTNVSNYSSEVADPRRVAPKWRSITAANAYSSIVERLERIRSNHPDITEAAAEVECQKELESMGFSGSIGRIRDAKTYVNKGAAIR